jgi:sugar lactone lactonase YvrE
MVWLKVGLIAAVALAVSVAVLHRLSPQLFSVSRDIEERTLRLRFSELEDAFLIEGMSAAENLHLDGASRKVYVTDLAGRLHEIDGPSWNRLALVRSVQLGTSAFGVDRGPDGALYVCVSNVGLRRWRKTGGAMLRVAPDLGSWETLADGFPGINGLAIAGDGQAYFASSPFHPLQAKGGVHRMPVAVDSTPSAPELAAAGLGMTNGVHFAASDGRVYFTETVVGAFAWSPADGDVKTIYRKTHWIEGFDDLCLDAQGRLWMADPGRSAVKCFDPATRHLTRFLIEGIGQTSACGIRPECGRDILYLTELHESRNPLIAGRDGRGLVVIPIDELLQAAREP